MRNFRVYFVLQIIVILSGRVHGQAKLPEVVVLGVSHSTQLINPNHQPAVLRAFIDLVNPTAICIERSPEEFLRQDYYEFTYEQQNVILPYAQKKNIPVYPIDWLPQEDDVQLAFGVSNLEVPTFTRRSEGFWGFTAFSDSTWLNRSLHFAEDEEYLKNLEKWYSTYPEDISADFSRRLFLYRTFLQAKNIQAVLRNFENDDRILVVIGAMHKQEIELFLEKKGFTIINSKSFGELTPEDLKEKFEPLDHYAVLNFNLLGMQEFFHISNQEMIDHALQELKTVQSSEMELYRLKDKQNKGQLNSKEVVKEYKDLLNKVNKEDVFHWTGVKDKNRIDSYFDPFGNMTVQQRIQLELAKEYWLSKDKEAYESLIGELKKQFSEFKKAMFLAYLKHYVELESR